MQQQIQAMLNHKKIPFVAVAECRKAMAAWPRLRHFHYVIYHPAGPSWLLLIGERTKVNRQMMRDWERVFGEGFKAVFAVRRKAGIVFVQDGGPPLSL